MSPRSTRRAVKRTLALGLSALLAAGSLSLAAGGTATAAEPNSSVTVPIVGGGEVVVSKTRDLSDGETIAVSGRFVAQAAVEKFVVAQAGTNYSPADGGQNAIRVYESTPVVADVVADSDEAGYRTFTTSVVVRSTLTSRQDGTVFDGRSHQTYLQVGGAWSNLTAGDGSTYTVAVAQRTSEPIYSSQLVPLTFDGGATNLTVDTPVTITAPPQSVTAQAGETITLAGAASGDPAPALQWQVSEDNGDSWSAVPGETSPTLTRRIVLSADGLQYRLRAENRISRAYSAAAVVSVTPAPPAPYDPGAFTMVTEGAGGRVTPLSGLVDGQRISIEARYYSVSGNNRTYEPLALGQYGVEPARPAILNPTRDGDAYVAVGEYVVARYLTNANGSVTDCAVTQCYVLVGGTVSTTDNSSLITDPALANTGKYDWINAFISDNLHTYYFPIFFEGSELVPPVPPAQVAPEVADQPDDVTVTAGYAAQFETVVTGDPAPSLQWQRSLDGGATWQTIRGQNLASIRIPTTEELNGSLYRVRAINTAGTTYSNAATLTVKPGSHDGNNPAADVTRKGISLDWIGSPELQRRTPAYTPNYYSAGVSEGNKATYKNAEGNTVIVFRPKDGSAEHATTFESIFAHLPKMPADPPTGDLQLARLNNGLVDRNDDGGGTIRWNATWSINFYGGLVPFTLRNPVLTWDAHGTGTLKADLLGYGSSMENPDVKFPLEPALGATVATFSNATIGADGTFTATPDYTGVSVDLPSDVPAQDKTVAGWGSWPQEFVDFQVKTGLHAYWYTSGLSADPYKAPSPFSVRGLSGFTIAPPAPEAPAAPTVTPVSGTELDVAWAKPAGGAPTGYTVTATHRASVVTAEVDGAALSARLSGLALGTEYAVTVTAKNAVGSSPASAATIATTFGAPAAPAAPILAAGEGTALVATWAAPASDGGSPVRGYDVTLRSGGEVVATRTVDAITATFEGLDRGTAYTATVAARNALGVSLESDASAPVTVAALAPSAPGAPTVTPGVGSLAVAWTAPAANGAVISGYTVTATPVQAGAGTVVTADTTGLTATLASLSRGTKYDVTVVARNAVGASAASAATSATTLAESPSGLGAPSVTTLSGAELLVAWAAPADDGGAAVTGYEVSVLRGAETVTTVAVGAEASSVTVAGLARGTEYTVTVTATNATGSVVSPASAAVRTFDVPAAPEVAAALSGANGVEVTWTAPENGGSAIIEYVVTLRNGATVLDTRLVAAGTESVTVHGIAPGTPVTASVVARNAVGDSASGTAAAVPVPAVAPGAPATPVVTVIGDESVEVTWIAPAFTGGSALTGYRVSLAGPAGVTVVGAAADATSAEIGDLGFGTYTASVIAVNAVGSSEPSAVSAVVKVVGPQPNGSPELAVDSLFDSPSAGTVEAVVSGGTATISVPGHEGEWIGVSIHSGPRFLGWHRVTDGVVRVEVPEGLTGPHHFVVYAADGSVIGYAAVEIPAATGGGNVTVVDSAGKGGKALAHTGADVNPTWTVLALLLLLAGAGALAVGRRTRRTRRS